jgi:hypothetical protein
MDEREILFLAFSSSSEGHSGVHVTQRLVHGYGWGVQYLVLVKADQHNPRNPQTRGQHRVRVYILLLGYERVIP